MAPFLNRVKYLVLTKLWVSARLLMALPKELLLIKVDLKKTLVAAFHRLLPLCGMRRGSPV